MTIAIFAYAIDVPGVICKDARLGGRKNLQQDNDHGQAGWTHGLVFHNLNDLASQLGKFGRGNIKRLGIHTHGVAGCIYPAGTKKPELALKSETIKIFHNDLHNIGLSTSEDATILFLGCLAGFGPTGTEFLKNLSSVWPGRLVVGFTTLGMSVGGIQKRDQENCTEPGMKDTNDGTAPTTREQMEAMESQWNKFPWASEVSPHAKTVRNRVVIKNADPPETPRKRVEDNKELFDLWKKFKKTTNKQERNEISIKYMSLKRALENKEKVNYVDPR